MMNNELDERSATVNSTKLSKLRCSSNLQLVKCHVVGFRREEFEGQKTIKKYVILSGIGSLIWTIGEF